MRETLRTWRLLRELRKARSRAEIAALQDALLRAAVEHAYGTVPFYRRVWDERGFDPGGFRGLADLDRIPRIDRANLRAASTDQLLSVGAEVTDRFDTSRSSGTALSVPRGPAEQRLWRATGLRMWLEHGYRWADLTVRLDSQAGPSHPLQRLGFSRTVWLLEEVPLQDRVARLLETRPDVVVGTPTELRRVCEALDARGAALRPKIVFSQGEVLPAGTRTQVERVLGVSPAQLYGLTEVGYVAWQCECRGPLHVNAEAYVVEVLRDRRPALAGELGRVVITDLRGRTMPLLRYDTGDLALAAEAPCECGRPLPLLGRMEGRADGALVRSDGEIVTTRAVVDALGPHGFRVRQDADGQIQLEVAPEANAARLAAELEALVGEPLARTTAIAAQPEAAGKTRWLVSELRPQLP
ncbi:MAG TPA: hypothetical protein VIM33_02540 [Gaiellaceae bacterium]